jgi:hypothetical protein
VVQFHEDTSPETPLAKSNSDPPPPPDGWQAPRGDAKGAHGALFGGMYGGGARFDWATGSGKVHTFQATGPAGVALAIFVFLVIGALISAFFLFAVGLGTAMALGAGAVAALGLGANAVRKRLTSTRGELGPGPTRPRSS